MATSRDSAQIAQNFMEMFAKGRLDEMKSKSDRRTALLDSLLGIELEQMNKDRQFLIEKGVNLPEADITEDFNNIISLTGNADIETALQMMLNSSKEKGALLDIAMVEYNKGQKLAKKSIAAGRAETAGEIDESRFLFSDLERTSVFEDPNYIKQGLIASNVDATGATTYSDAFQAGFEEGSYSIDEAMKRLSEDQLIQTQDMALKEARLDEAEKINNRLASSIGSTLVANIMTQGKLPVMMYKGALGGSDEVRETFANAIDAMNSDKIWLPNIKAELVTAINLYADPTSQIDNHMGFVRMAGKAYGLMVENSSMEQALVDKMVNVTTPGQASALLSDTTSNFYDDKYVSNLVVLQEYASVGVMPSDIKVAEKAYVTMSQYDNIQIGAMNVAHKNAAELSELTGMGYDEIDDSLVKIGTSDFETRMSKWEDVESTYNDLFPDGTESGISGEAEELGLGLNLPADSDITELHELTRKEAVDRTNASKLVRGGTLLEYKKVKSIPTGEIISEGQSLSGLQNELRAYGLGGQYTIYDNLPGFQEHELKGQPQDYVPTSDEMDTIRARLQRWINDQLTIGSRSHEGLGGGVADLFGSLPGTSLLVELGGLYPGKDALEVAGNVSDVRDAMALWDQYANMWNRVRQAQGKQKISIGKLTEKVSNFK